MAYWPNDLPIEAHAAVSEDVTPIVVSIGVPRISHGAQSMATTHYYLFPDNARTLRDELTAALDAIDAKEKTDAGQ